MPDVLLEPESPLHTSPCDDDCSSLGNRPSTDQLHPFSCCAICTIHPDPLPTCVCVAVHGVHVVGAQWQHLIVPRAADSAVDVELVDDEIGLEPPA